MGNKSKDFKKKINKTHTQCVCARQTQFAEAREGVREGEPSLVSLLFRFDLL